MTSQKYSIRDPKTQSSNDLRYREEIGPHFEASRGTALDKLENFARFVPRQSLALFLAKNNLFQLILECHGSIVECGVFLGGGLFSWAQLSAIYEPVNHNRKIIGFDSFDGFPAIGEADKAMTEAGDIHHKTKGGYFFDGEDELWDCAALFDLNRPVGHVPKIELVKGDANITIPEY